MIHKRGAHERRTSIVDLTDAEARALHLVENEKLTLAKAAEKLGVSRNAVKNLLVTAREKTRLLRLGV